MGTQGAGPALAHLRPKPMAVKSQAPLLRALQDRLGYRFQDETLLRRALTHKSASKRHNERLEFLGDAVLGYVIAEHLHRTRRSHGEDGLSLLRAALVRRESLVAAALELNLGEQLMLGPGALASGAHERASVLANALEALIGSVHEDGGIEAARSLILDLFRERLRNLDSLAAKDAKTDLQERVQARGLQRPDYRLLEIEGQPHEQVINVACEMAQLSISVTAAGRSRKEAEKRAAARMIQALEAQEAGNEA